MDSPLKAPDGDKLCLDIGRAKSSCTALADMEEMVGVWKHRAPRQRCIDQVESGNRQPAKSGTNRKLQHDSGQ